jgi:hypothetical protein
MSRRNPATPPSKVLGFFRGLGELTAFSREGALAVLEVAIGRWPLPVGDRSTVKRDETIIVPARLSEPREAGTTDGIASTKSALCRSAPAAPK